jgi:hypothetical protein
MQPDTTQFEEQVPRITNPIPEKQKTLLYSTVDVAAFRRQVRQILEGCGELLAK